MLARYQKLIYEIKKVLLNDAEVRNLLYHDSNNAANMLPPAEQEMEKYITVFPVYTFQDKHDYFQNAFINIYLTDCNYDDEDNTTNAVIQISIVVNIDQWDLVNNQIRPLALANRIIKLINNKKFSVSNPIVFDSLQENVVTKNMVGYALLFRAADGSSNLENY